MFNFLKKYHYIPPCPKCGSCKTGRYLYLSSQTFDIEKIIAQHMKNGELVKVIYGFPTEFDNNVYCEECGIEWSISIQEMKYTETLVKQEKNKRGITKTKYEEMWNHKSILKEKIKEQKQKEKRERKEKKKKNAARKQC